MQAPTRARNELKKDCEQLIRQSPMHNRLEHALIIRAKGIRICKHEPPKACLLIMFEPRDYVGSRGGLPTTTKSSLRDATWTDAESVSPLLEELGRIIKLLQASGEHIATSNGLELTVEKRDHNYKFWFQGGQS